MSEFNKWMGQQGFNALLHANCCRIAFDGGQESKQAEIDQLKAELVLCREENKGLVGSLSKQRQINIALNSETIKQREQIQHYMGKCVEQNKQVEDQQKRIDFALHAIKDPEAHLCDQAWFALKALRGGDQNTKNKAQSIENIGHEGGDQKRSEG